MKVGQIKVGVGEGGGLKNLITKTNQNWRVKVNTDEGWGWED